MSLAAGRSSTFFRRADSFTNMQARTPFNEIIRNDRQRKATIPRYSMAVRSKDVVKKRDYSVDNTDGGFNSNQRNSPSRQHNTYGHHSNHVNHNHNTINNRTTYLQQKYIHPFVEHDRREKITINVSGERYQTFVDTLDRFPETLLGNTLKREEFYDDVEDEYFFDRDRTAFNAILYYYQSYGQLYCPLTVPMTILVTEAKFFQLGNDAIKQVLDLNAEDSQLLMPKNKWQRKIWCLFEHPETSRAAHFLTLFSVLMIIFSVTTLCVETLPEFRNSGSNNYDLTNGGNIGSLLTQSIIVELTLNNRTKYMTNYTGTNVMVMDTDSSSYKQQQNCKCLCQCNLYNNTLNQPPSDDQNEENDNKKIFFIFEMVSVIWFTIEYVVRLLTSPDRKKFIKGFLNIIDVISILPFYITAGLNRHEGGFGIENFRVFRLVRVFRVFKLSRHSKGLQILGHTLRDSMRELGLMVFVLGIGVILFSSAVYYLESDNFDSIPDAFWWAIITMCTVGYGDKVPQTFWGKVVGSACSICGVLSIALPVPVIVSNFDYFYNRERTKKMHESFLESSKAEITPSTNHHLSNAVKKSPVVRYDSDEHLTADKRSMDLSQQPHRPCKLSVASSLSGSPVLYHQKNGSVRSPNDTRSDEIQRQAALKGLEKKSRKLSQRLSENSVNSPHRSRNGFSNNSNTSINNNLERESLM